MKTIVIVFTNDNGEYYIEGVFSSMEKAQEEWELDKVIDGRPNGAWELLQSELYEPTIQDSRQLGIIQEVQ